MLIKRCLARCILFSIWVIATNSLAMSTQNIFKIENSNTHTASTNDDKSRDIITAEELAATFICDCDKESLQNIFINPQFLTGLCTADPAFVAHPLKNLHIVFQHPTTQQYLKNRCKNASLAEVESIMQKRAKYAKAIKEALENFLQKPTPSLNDASNIIALTDEDYLNALEDLEIMHTIIKKAYAEKINAPLPWRPSSLQYRIFKYVTVGIVVGVLVRAIIRYAKKPKPQKAVSSLSDHAEVAHAEESI